jgi:hypothetical protein
VLPLTSTETLVVSSSLSDLNYLERVKNSCFVMDSFIVSFMRNCKARFRSRRVKDGARSNALQREKKVTSGRRNVEGYPPTTIDVSISHLLVVLRENRYHLPIVLPTTHSIPCSKLASIEKEAHHMSRAMTVLKMSSV